MAAEKRMDPKDEQQFLDLVKEIVEHPKYTKLKEYIQHGETTAFDNCSVTVKDVVAMKNGVFVVPVAFNGENFEYYVIVYVKKTGAGFKIASVSDVYPY